MKEIDKFIKGFTLLKLVNSLVVIVISMILYKITVYLLTKGENHDKISSDKKNKTYIRLVKSIVKKVYIVLTIVIILQINGFNVNSLLAGIGIVGVIVGLAIQDWLKDIIRGHTILTDNYFAVGDIVKINGIEGKVIVIGLKTTKIRGLFGNVTSIANRNIETVEVISNLAYIDVPLPYELEVKKQDKLIEEMVKKIEKVDNVNEVTYLGIADLESSYVKHMIQIESTPINKRQARRDAIKEILLVLEKNKVSVPYNQLDIHQK